MNAKAEKSKAVEVKLVNIGDASTATGISQKMIRHYESHGLLGNLPRTDNGYRVYDDNALHTLTFIRKARDMGFGIAEIGKLVELWHNRRRSSATVKKMAEAHVSELQQRVDALQAMQRSLQDLIKQCAGDNRPGCPILDDLSGKAKKPAKAKK